MGQSTGISHCRRLQPWVLSPWCPGHSSSPRSFSPVYLLRWPPSVFPHHGVTLATGLIPPSVDTTILLGVLRFLAPMLRLYRDSMHANDMLPSRKSVAGPYRYSPGIQWSLAL